MTFFSLSSFFLYIAIPYRLRQNDGSLSELTNLFHQGCRLGFPECFVFLVLVQPAVVLLLKTYPPFSCISDRRRSGCNCY